MTSLNRPSSKLQPRLGILTHLWLLGTILAWLPLALLIDRSPFLDLTKQLALVGMAWALAVLAGWLIADGIVQPIKAILSVFCFGASVRLGTLMSSDFTHGAFYRTVILLGALTALSALSFRWFPQRNWLVGNTPNSLRNSQFSIRELMGATLVAAIWLAMVQRYDLTHFQWQATLPMFAVALLASHGLIRAIFSQGVLWKVPLVFGLANAAIIGVYRVLTLSMVVEPLPREATLAYALTLTSTIMVTAIFGRLDSVPQVSGQSETVP